MTCFVCGQQTASMPCNTGPCREFWRDVVVRAALEAHSGRRRLFRLKARCPGSDPVFSLAANKPALRARSAGACERCGSTSRTLHAHRIVPGRFWGQYVSHNVRILCPGCHRKEELSGPATVEEAVRRDARYQIISARVKAAGWSELLGQGESVPVPEGQSASDAA
jgi:5-methylcytosine-specific restriction endonuclease McrA